MQEQLCFCRVENVDVMIRCSPSHTMQQRNQSLGFADCSSSTSAHVDFHITLGCA